MLFVYPKKLCVVLKPYYFKKLNNTAVLIQQTTVFSTVLYKLIDIL